MESATVEVKTPDGVADAYLTRPEGGGDHRGVLLMIDAFGLRRRIEEMADRIAGQGYAVLAPNVFYRAGRASELSIPAFDPENRAAFMQALRPLIQQLTPEAFVRDGKAYLDFLADLAPGPFGITGYCMGGRLGWRIAAADPERVAALGCFHTGGLVSDAPDSPHLSAQQINAELYLGYADKDAGATPEQIATLDRALDEAGVRHRSEVYEGALHGYTMSDTPVYDEAATERHYAELFALLSRALDGR